MRFVILSFFLLFLLLPSFSAHNYSTWNQNPTQNHSLSQTIGDSIDYLIITSEDFESAVQPLYIWKMQRGLVSTIVTVETISATYAGEDLAEKVRNCIIDYHSNHNTLWVVLAGSENYLPVRTVEARYVSRDGYVHSPYVSCDAYYSNLDENWNLDADGVATLIDGDDWEPEVYIGRLSANSESQLSSLVSRLIQYEKNPPVGSWMKHAVFAGTFVNFDCDINGNNVFDDGDFPEFDTNREHNWIKSNLLPDGWTSTLLAEGEGLKSTDYPYDAQLNKTSLVDAINSGASMVMADAHGSSSGMSRMIFTYDQDGDNLFDSEVDNVQSTWFLQKYTDFDTEGKLAMHFFAACQTGTFVGRECLTEYIARNVGIGCIGASGSVEPDPFGYDGDHLGWLTQGLEERFWEQLLVLGNNQPGKALALAKYDYSLDRVEMDGEDDGGRTLAQYNLMGDPEVPIWVDIPHQLNVSIDQPFNNNINTMTLKITANRDPVEAATITYTKGNNLLWKGDTNENGTIDVPFSDIEVGDNVFTASKKGYLPFQANLPHALRGDINKDGICDILDVATAAIAFGCVPEDLRWDERADVDGNGIVNILDIAVIAVDFGKTV